MSSLVRTSMSSTTSRYYAFACSVLVGLAVTGWWCWSRQSGSSLGGGGEEDDETDETKSLIRGKGKKVSKAIAKFESRNNAVTTVKRKAHHHVERKNQPSVQQRCAACRKVLSATAHKKKKKNYLFFWKKNPPEEEEEVIRFRGDQLLHNDCFRCNDCQKLLARHPHETVQVHKVNLRFRYQCQDCSSSKHLEAQAIKPARAPGVAITIEQYEKGDTQQTLQEIGDDLNEAMYFLHPKCCVCGGGLYDNEKTNPVADYQRGNWKYHRYCYYSSGENDNNNNDNNNKQPKVLPVQRDSKNNDTIQKLSPAHSAKYLPDPLVLQLTSSSSSSTAVVDNDSSKSSTIRTTTLYFVWKDRDNHADKLRKEKSQESTVIIPFTLDEQAPANPNYVHQAGPELFSEGMQKHKKNNNKNKDKKQKRLQQQQQPRKFNKKILELPATTATILTNTNDPTLVEGFQLKLLGWEQVAPLQPRMVEPARLCELIDDTNNNNNHRRSLVARLQCMKFGLWYEFILTIALVVVGKEQQEEKTILLNLEEAKLVVKIQEERPSKSQQAAAMGTKEQ